MEATGTTESRRRYRPTLRFGGIHGMPLRLRLILAFAVLIISSASVTIWIGNAVLGSKVDELARGHIALNGRLAYQALQSRLEILRFLAQDVAARHASGSEALDLARTAGEAAPLDFLILIDPPKASFLLLSPSTGTRSAGAPAAPVVVHVEETGLPHGALSSLFERALSENKPISGLVAAAQAEIASLSGKSAQDGLMLIAAAPLGKREGGGVLLGNILNGRTPILEQIRDMLPPEETEHVRITIFFRDRSIASSEGDEEIGSLADPRALDTVLRRGEPYSGIIGSPRRRRYAAYLPLRDPSNTVVGMLGLDGSADAVAAIRRRTAALFSGLIAAGMFFGLIMTLLFSAWLVHPISQLAEGVSRVAAGDLDHKVRIESQDELGKLAHAFNRMVRTVKERDHKLREMTEDRLTQVEKQVSIGRLAAGVAHEINNPLTAILTLSSLWLKKMPLDDPRRESLEIIVTETSRCREIVRSLLDFARERPIEKRVIDMNAVVREALRLADKYDSMANMKVEQAIAPVPLLVNADMKLLEQVLINLLLNAAEAAEPGGIVRVETDEDSSGGFIQVKVVDRGKGIPKEHINRVFEPFFTTKGTGKGTGLGLSVSLGIVQKHEGVIEIESEEGRGTTVTVLLPRAGEATP